MRPVTRGAAPRKYTNYQDAIGDLEERLDRYCSYCERRFPGSLAVEHIVPKSKNKSLMTTWSNFLIGCVNCNSAKGSKPTNAKDFVWPDRDNTFLAIAYKNGGIVEVSSTLPPKLQKQVRKTIDLVGLDRHPGQPPGKRPRKRDKRYMDREEAWKFAILKRDALKQNDTIQLREAIADVAKFQGFFSVWMTVFDKDKDMRRRLFGVFKGTTRECFNKNWKCVPRPRGHI